MRHLLKYRESSTASRASVRTANQWANTGLCRGTQEDVRNEKDHSPRPQAFEARQEAIAVLHVHQKDHVHGRVHGTNIQGQMPAQWNMKNTGDTKVSKPETMMIDDVKYVREDAVKHETVILSEYDSLASPMIGQFVIVRTRNEGINAGTVEAADETGVILADCRRIYYHRPKDAKLSWYEGVAQTGLSDNSKVSGTVPRKVIIEDYSLTSCTDAAKTSIMGMTPNAQN
jgi:hypothetical protein